MQVRIVDSAPGSASFHQPLEIPRGTCTVRELICERVRHEVAYWNDRKPALYRPLVEPSDTERLLNGERPKRFEAQDPELHCQRALRAFERQGYLVIVAGRQVQSLDEELQLTEACEVEFFRLVPLVGG